MSGPTLLFLRILLAASLYAFLAAALLILWRDLKRQTEMARLQKAPQITLQGSNGVGLYKFTKHEVMIGRDPTHDISLNDKTVSTQHARLTYHHNHWWVEDLESTNGTFLNQEPVSSPAIIVTGDQVQCGQVLFKIIIEANPSQG